MIFKQQQKIKLERFVNLECDLTISGNVLPAKTVLKTYFENGNHSLMEILNLIGENNFGKITQPLDLSKFAILKVTSKISFKDKNSWMKNDLYKEYSKYKENFKSGDEFPPILLAHPFLLSRLFNVTGVNELYQIDGMHRVMSSLEAGLDEIETYVLIHRIDLHRLMSQSDKQKINELGSRCTWFPRYQEIREVGLKGQRVQEPRYTKIYNFNNLEGKTVVDFGGNLGQSAVEAYFNGADKIYNFDYQKCVVDTGNEISRIFGFNIEHNTIDFNLPSFEEDVFKIVKEWDWAVYQAIYRTKEILDVNKSFTFIVNNTKEGLYFEGNADPRLDTPQFYNGVFKPFNFKEITFLGHSQNRPAYKIIK